MIVKYSRTSLPRFKRWKGVEIRWLVLIVVCVLGAGCVQTGVLATMPVQGTTPLKVRTRGVEDRATWTATPAPLETPTPSPTATFFATPTRTPVPTWTPTPDPRRHVIAFVSDWAGNDDIYLYDLASGEVINLTNAPGEERDPVFLPGGRALAYRSNAGDGWRYYQVDLSTGERGLLLPDLAAPSAYRGDMAWSSKPDDRFVYTVYHQERLDLYIDTEQGLHRPLSVPLTGGYGPAWRPTASQIVFTSWQEGQKDLYLVDADGSNLTRLTDASVDEEDPAWHPGGQRLAFVRHQGYDTDLYELDLESGAIAQLTSDPYPDRSPTYAADGTLFWVRYVPGKPFEVHDPYEPGHWRLWMRTPDGKERPVLLNPEDMDVYTPAAGFALWPDRDLPVPVSPTCTPTLAPGEWVGLTDLEVQSAGGNARIHARLADAYLAWRAEVSVQSGYDFMGTVSDMFRPLGYSGRDYGHLSWHRTGRAVDLLFEWRDPVDGENLLLVMREDLGPQTYWRLYLRCRAQDGTMGEPLTVAPWIFWFDLDPDTEPAAYAAGGRPGPVPAGYYVDLTRLAARHGWYRIASYEEADYDWRTDSLGREFWHYQRTDGLTWWQAMLQIYPAEMVERYYAWEVCVNKLAIDRSWLSGKGIPTPTPSGAESHLP